ncbi:MAG TPA: YraN family protein, partial [Anseongella sp.]|nr:YraN family protein [Anseongella sp.]
LERGYTLVKRNFHFGRAGEIDLVMRDGDIYVFIEVKARRSRGFGLPEDALTVSKRRQIRKVAEGFIYVNRITGYTARFDVIAIDYVTGAGGEPEIRHHIDAF